MNTLLVALLMSGSLMSPPAPEPKTFPPCGRDDVYKAIYITINIRAGRSAA